MLQVRHVEYHGLAGILAFFCGKLRSWILFGRESEVTVRNISFLLPII